MTRPITRLFLVLALVAVGACEEEMTSLESGTPSTVSVRAYVDSDGDGSFSAGDRTLDGATVTLAGVGVSRDATVGSDGVASFTGVLPGSYSLSLQGGVPAGAVLATASQPVVVAPFRGRQIDAEFRYTFLPGTLSGRVFRDDDGSGDFTPGTDLAAQGIRALLYRGATAEGDPVAEAVTDEDGFFTFEDVRPGTWTVDVQALPSMDLLGAGTRTVEVGAAATTDLAFEFEGSLLLDIADARQAPEGQVVTVQGTVSWQTPWDDRVYFFEDATGGISTFDFSGPELEVGDRIEVLGEVASFRGETQLSPVQSVTVLSAGAPPAPTGVTATEIVAGEHQGRLVTITGVVDSVDVRSFGNQMVFLTDRAGDGFTVYADSRTGVTDDLWTVGDMVRVTGVLGTDDRETPAPRIEIRSPDDLEAAQAGVLSIAEARGRSGETVTVEGVVTWQTGWDERVYFFQDGTGGISTFHFGAPDLARGERIRVTGEVSAFRGEVQISPDEVTVVGTPGVPEALAVDGAAINAGFFQGQLVTATGTAVSVEQVNDFGTHVVTLEDDAGTLFSVYVDNRAGLSVDDWEVGTVYAVTGVLGTDDRDERPHRLEVRDAADQEVVG